MNLNCLSIEKNVGMVPPWGTSKGASFTYNSEFFKLNCGYDGDSAVEFVYSMPSVIKVESLMNKMEPIFSFN